jgi:hypothetical protein
MIKGRRTENREMVVPLESVRFSKVTKFIRN